MARRRDWTNDFLDSLVGGALAGALALVPGEIWWPGRVTQVALAVAIGMGVVLFVFQSREL